MLEILLVVMGLMFAGDQHSKEQEFYRGVVYGCVGGVAVYLDQNSITVPDEQVYAYCSNVLLVAQEKNLYAK